MPLWLQYAQAFSTIAIGVLALALAWAQWHTARSKLVLDLFNQRIDVYNNLNRGCSEVVRYSKMRLETAPAFTKACRQARFLFDKGFYKRVEDVQRAIELIEDLDKKIDRTPSEGKPATTATYDERDRHWNVLTKFYEELPRLVEPYARMDEKKPLYWLRRN